MDAESPSTFVRVGHCFPRIADEKFGLISTFLPREHISWADIAK